MVMAVKQDGKENPSVAIETDYYEARNFPELYDEYFDRVNRYLRCRVHSSWDADDLTTSVFLKALEKFDQYSRRSPFASWIFRIAHNTFIDFVRKVREYPTEAEELLFIEADDEYQPELRVLSKEEMTLLRTRLNMLSQDQRDVLTLRFFADLKISQVAEVLGKSESSVKMISHRGIKVLQSFYEEGDRHEG